MVRASDLFDPGAPAATATQTGPISIGADVGGGRLSLIVLGLAPVGASDLLDPGAPAASAPLLRGWCRPRCEQTGPISIGADVGGGRPLVVLGLALVGANNLALENAAEVTSPSLLSHLGVDVARGLPLIVLGLAPAGVEVLVVRKAGESALRPLIARFLVRRRRYVRLHGGRRCAEPGHHRRWAEFRAAPCVTFFARTFLARSSRQRATRCAVVVCPFLLRW